MSGGRVFLFWGCAEGNGAAKGGQNGIEDHRRDRLNAGNVVAKSLVWICACLLAAGLAVSQILLGGLWYPALAAPGYLLVGAAAVAAGLAFWNAEDPPGAVCSGITLLFAGYLFWRQWEAPDAYVAREDAWLLLGALAVYFTAAWQLRGDGPRWLLLGVLFVLACVHVVIAVAQFASTAPFHPLADLALHMNLPRGDGHLANRGWVSGTLESRGSLSSILQITSFLALGMLVWGRAGAGVKMLLMWAAAAGFAVLALSMSRAAYFGLPAGVLVFALTSFFIVRRGALAHRGWLGAGALALVALALGLGMLVGAESVSVQLRVSEMGSDDYREKLWFITAPPMLALDPWLGAGASMFDQLSLRYRGAGFTGRAVHAHNDWLQLLVEYGRAGFALGAAFFAVHLVAGWRNALRMAREMPPAGLLPQGMDLGLTTGALAAGASQGVHAFFDYRMHVPAVVLLLALCAGWLAGARLGTPPGERWPMPRWLRVLAFAFPFVPGAALVWWVAREAPAEHRALQAHNAIMRGDPALARDLVEQGLGLSPGNPRLLTLAGESAQALGNASSDPTERMEWYRRAADEFGAVTRHRPYFGHAWRELALCLERYGRPRTALPAHLRAIGREPYDARGYEYLALHYWRQGRTDEAERLFRLAQTLQGTSLARDYLKIIEQERRRGAQTR